MTQILSHGILRKVFSKNTPKFILNINFEIKFAHSVTKPIDLLQINRKNMKYITLSGTGSYQMPIIGIGTWKALDNDVYDSLQIALNVGYRHIDTAFNYNNEEEIGKVINEWIESGKGTRDSLFVTTKLPNFGNRARDVEKYLTLSLNKLNLTYIDLYLIHMPFAFQSNVENTAPLTDEDGVVQLDLENDNVATWKAMEEQVKIGLVRSIGLSNFNAKQVEHIYENAEIKPAVLQVELHAHLQQNKLVETCRRLNIAVTAFAPLGSPAAPDHFLKKYNYQVKSIPNLLTDPIVEVIAKKYNKTTGQVLLKHTTQKDIAVIPKSTNPKRIEENFQIFDFELEPEDMEKLNGLDKNENGRVFNFLCYKGVENHPEYPFKDSL